MSPLLARRQERAFERLYRRHVGDVYRYALVVLRSPEDAEDVTQTTFLNAYRAVRRGEHPEKPLNWLITIAHNVCRQRFRQLARRPSEVAFEEGTAEAVVEDEATPTAEDIRRALGQLAFNQRAALVMREIEGRSYAEIAQILDVSVGAVETLIFRARQALREQLEGTLTCHEAERAVSRQLDGRLPRSEKAMLRAHLRACPECAHFARSQRAQRSAIRSLALIPVPETLRYFFGPDGIFGGPAGGAAAGAGAGVAAKAAAFSASALMAGGVATGGADPREWRGAQQADRVRQVAAPAPEATGDAPAAEEAARQARELGAQRRGEGQRAGPARRSGGRATTAPGSAPRTVAERVAAEVAEVEAGPAFPGTRGRKRGHTKPAPPRASPRGLERGRGHQRPRAVNPHAPPAPGGQPRRRAKPKPRPAPRGQTTENRRRAEHPRPQPPPPPKPKPPRNPEPPPPPPPPPPAETADGASFAP